MTWLAVSLWSARVDKSTIWSEVEWTKYLVPFAELRHTVEVINRGFARNEMGRKERVGAVFEKLLDSPARGLVEMSTKEVIRYRKRRETSNGRSVSATELKEGKGLGPI